MSIFSRWPYSWFGCWSEFGSRYSKCPSIQDFIDPSWHYAELDRLTSYLAVAPLIATTSRLSIPWAIEPGDGRSTISYRSDGIWLWLDDLDYYVTRHQLRLPDSFIIHIEQNNYIPPDSLNKDISEFSWPPIDD
jgi:hypothetical protein